MRKKIRHIALFIAGWCFILLGIIGVLLPVMPGMLFFILAAYCFSETSPKFHHLLLNNRWIGPALKQWDQTRTVQPALKYTAMLFIGLAMVVSLITLKGQIYLQFLSAAFYFLLLAIIAQLHTAKS